MQEYIKTVTEASFRSLVPPFRVRVGNDIITNFIKHDGSIGVIIDIGYFDEDTIILRNAMINRLAKALGDNLNKYNLTIAMPKM